MNTIANTLRAGLFASAAAFCFAGGPAFAQITFEQVFGNPENAQLNLDYARQEAAAGNLLQAASTLERLLYAEPNWDSARLFYTDVLIQLDDRQGAQREIDILQSRPLSIPQRADLNRYDAVLRGAPVASGKPALSGRVSAGVRYDDNGANALTDVVGRTGSEDDVSAVIRASLSGFKPLTSGLNLLGGLGANLRLPSESGSRSYRDLNTNIGLGGGDSIEWTARFGARAIALDGDDFLTEIGPRAGVTVALSGATDLRLGAAAVYQDYKSLPGLFNEKFRSGQKYALSAGLSHKLSDKTRIGGALGYDMKNAKADILAYDAWRISGDVFHALSSDQYLQGQVSYRALDFDGVNGFATPPRARDDDHIYARAAYGMRLSAMSDIFAAADTVFIEGAVDVIDRGSNISVFDYNNTGAQLSLIWDF